MLAALEIILAKKIVCRFAKQEKTAYIKRQSKVICHSKLDGAKMSRKNLLALLAVALLGLCGCSKSPKVSFKVGFDADFPPYGYIQDGKYVGFDLDLAREVARRNHWKLVLVPIKWDDKDIKLETGAIDCIWSGFTINGREDAYLWSEPYVDNRQVVLLRKDSVLQTIPDLAGYMVAVQTDTPVFKLLSAGGEREELGRTFKKLVVCPNYKAALKELENGGVDAVVLDISVAQEKLKTGKFRMLDEALIGEKFGIGFRKGDIALRDQVQKTLLEMIADGSAAAISARYFNGKNVLILK